MARAPCDSCDCGTGGGFFDRRLVLTSAAIARGQWASDRRVMLLLTLADTGRNCEDITFRGRLPKGVQKMSKLLAAAVALAGVAVFAVGTGGAANDHAAAAAVCPAAVVGFAQCHALVTVDRQGNPYASTAPTGLSPSTIKSVYGFPTSG